MIYLTENRRHYITMRKLFYILGISVILMSHSNATTINIVEFVEDQGLDPDEIDDWGIEINAAFSLLESKGFPGSVFLPSPFGSSKFICSLYTANGILNESEALVNSSLGPIELIGVGPGWMIISEYGNWNITESTNSIPLTSK